jgi:hypothetical protein
MKSQVASVNPAKLDSNEESKSTTNDSTDTSAHSKSALKMHEVRCKNFPTASDCTNETHKKTQEYEAEAQAAMKMMDRNGDNLADAKELAAATGITEKQAAAEIALLDLNKDKRLSVTELRIAKSTKSEADKKNNKVGNQLRSTGTSSGAFGRVFCSPEHPCTVPHKSGMREGQRVKNKPPTAAQRKALALAAAQKKKPATTRANRSGRRTKNRAPKSSTNEEPTELRVRLYITVRYGIVIRYGMVSVQYSCLPSFIRFRSIFLSLWCVPVPHHTS